MAKIYVVALCLLALVSSVFAASCAADAYRKACSGCSFDANGKIDQQCMKGYQSGGTSCVATSYPIAASKYAKGECAAIDDCASELRSCTGQYSSGNDSADCAEGSVAVCYAAADQCTRSAAVKCGEVTTQCPGTGLILLSVGLGLVFLRRQ